jgi:hypothetical protein
VSGRPLQNRVTPYGELVAVPARGTLFGNRGGRLHRDDRTLAPARWKSRAWIACVLAFKGRSREVFGPGYTELFFLDEATALAAGHRPCAECRRADFNRFAEAWAAGHGLAEAPRAPAMDAVLHRERLVSARPAALPPSDLEGLPDGTMVEHGGAAHLVLGDRLLAWSHDGYSRVVPRPSGPGRLITPPAVAAVLAAGYRPLLHPSAARLAGRAPSA